MPSLLFIVSTGRTGTLSLADIFTTLGVRARHEPGPRWLRNVSNAYVTGRISLGSAVRLLRLARRHLVRNPGRTYVESSCLIYGLVEPLLTLFPEASVVQIVRDPRTYVRSAANWGAHRFAGRALNVLPFRRLAPPQFEPLSLAARIAWAKANQLERLSWTWARMNRAMREQGGSSSGFTTERFEDVFDKGRGYPGLIRICSILGLQTTPQEIVRAAARRNRSRERRLLDWEHWPAEAQEHLLTTCSEEAARYRYDLARPV